MDIDDFYTDLRNQTAARATLSGDYTSDAFMREVADRLAESGVVDNLNVVNFDGVGARNRRLTVNGYDLNDGDESVALAVLHYTGASELTTLTATQARDSLKRLLAFLEDARSGDFARGREPSAQEVQLADDLHRRRAPVLRYRLYLVTDCVLSDRAPATDAGDIDGLPVEFHIWDIRRMHQISESSSGREELEIDLTQWAGDGVPALRVPDTAGDLETYLAVLPGKLVADLYARYGSRLLEGNVRSFLTVRGKTNQGIRRTILNEPSHFLAYNNGISATASAVTTRDGSLTRIRDLQIVNGGQTTASLFYTQRDAKGADLTDVYLQMKLVVVAPETADEMIPRISRFTNSQNAVSEADFFSNHPFHVRMEDLSKRVLAPAAAGTSFHTKWYYERTRGQHQNERNRRSGAEQKRFDAEYPKAQLITKTDAAKYEVSWGQRPHQVSAGAQKNFRAYAEMVAARFTKNEQEFQETYFKELVAKAVIFQAVRASIIKSGWYEPGQYLANLTTYAIAKMSHAIDSEPRAKGFSLLTVWEEQNASLPFLKEAVRAAHLALGHLTDPKRPVGNVTEWAKREQCWKDFARIQFTLGEEFLFECIPTKKNVAGTREVTVNSRFDPDISARAHVRDIDIKTWPSVASHLRQLGKLTSTEQRALMAVMSSRRVMSNDDAFELLRILVKAENLGFSHTSR